MTRSPSRLWCLLPAALAITGCPSEEDGAKEDFSRDVTCPVDRVQVRARTDLHPTDWLEKKVPPADIASDPGRLKMWQTAQDEERTRANSSDDIFEASGCGTQRLYACHRHNTNANRIMCFHQQPLPGSTPPIASVAAKGPYAQWPEVLSAQRALSRPFRKCINAGLALDPKMTGQASVVAAVDAAGHVGSVTITGSFPASVTSCIEAQVKGAQFPVPKDGPATLTIPVALGGS